MREKVLQWVEKYKVIAIVRGAEPEQCTKVAEALFDGGIRLMEITYDQRRPESWPATAEAIGRLAKEYEGKMLVGAGTVTNVKLVELTAQAGGCFIVSPDTDAQVIEKTRELGLVSMPGAMTPSEIKAAHDFGADYVKLFPVGSMGAGYLRAVRAPLSHIRILAVGGVNENNICTYLEAGAVGAGIGGNLANKEWIARGEFGKITETARSLMEAVTDFCK